MEKLIVTTSWDDGHLLDVKLANLLKKYKIKGTFYVSPRDREFSKEQLLSDYQVIALSQDFEIGAHTMTHPHLTAVDLKTAKKEIIDSKKYLKKILNKEVTSFCFPSGDYNEEHKKIVKDAGFSISRTVERFKTNITDRFAVPTTVHCYRHYSDAFRILDEVGVSRFFKSFFNWDELAIILFDKTLEKGGVFHLWGHSWEIEKNNDWGRLERVLQYMSNKSGVKFVTNGELI